MDSTLDKIIKQAYSVIGRGEKLRPEHIDSAINLLEAMLDSWVNRGFDTWRMKTLRVSLPVQTVVAHDDVRYLCVRSHTSTADTEPGTGDNYKPYWVEIKGDVEILDVSWAVATAYEAQNTVAVVDPDLAHISGYAKLLADNDVSVVKFLPQRKFAELSPSDTGTPSKVTAAPATANNSWVLTLNPTPVELVGELELRALCYRNDLESTIPAPRSWYLAIQYNLAVELGYANGIPQDVLTGIVNKAQFEFRKARGADTEVEDRCFVDSLY